VFCTRTARPPDGDPNETLKDQLRTYLLSLTVPGKPQEADLQAIAADICDEKSFELFRRNTKLKGAASVSGNCCSP